MEPTTNNNGEKIAAQAASEEGWKGYNTVTAAVIEGIQQMGGYIFVTAAAVVKISKVSMMKGCMGMSRMALAIKRNRFNHALWGNTPTEGEKQRMQANRFLVKATLIRFKALKSRTCT